MIGYREGGRGQPTALSPLALLCVSFSIRSALSPPRLYGVSFSSRAQQLSLSCLWVSSPEHGIWLWSDFPLPTAFSSITRAALLAYLHPGPFIGCPGECTWRALLNPKVTQGWPRVVHAPDSCSREMLPRQLIPSLAPRRPGNSGLSREPADGASSLPSFLGVVRGHLLRGDRSEIVPDIRIQAARHAGNVNIHWLSTGGPPGRPRWHQQQCLVITGIPLPSGEVQAWWGRALVTRRHPDFSMSPRFTGSRPWPQIRTHHPWGVGSSALGAHTLGQVGGETYLSQGKTRRGYALQNVKTYAAPSTMNSHIAGGINNPHSALIILSFQKVSTSRPGRRCLPPSSPLPTTPSPPLPSLKVTAHRLIHARLEGFIFSCWKVTHGLCLHFLFDRNRKLQYP